MPEDELSRFELSGANVPEEARMQAYYAGQADATAQRAAEEAVYEGEGAEVDVRPVQADTTQTRAANAAAPTAAQTDVAAQTPEEADAWRRAVDLAYEAGRRGMPEDELDLSLIHI